MRVVLAMAHQVVGPHHVQRRIGEHHVGRERGSAGEQDRSSRDHERERGAEHRPAAVAPAHDPQPGPAHDQARRPHGREHVRRGRRNRVDVGGQLRDADQRRQPDDAE